MTGIATLASGSYGVDTNAKLTAQSAQSLRAATYEGQVIDFVARYVSIGPAAPGDITSQELDAILGAGLALLLVQHVRFPGWVPSGAQGATDGAHAAQNASAAGYPQTAHIAFDLEGVAPGTSADAVAAHANEWSAAVVGAGYQAMLYVGYNAILTPQQLYDLPNFNRYWSDFGERQVAVRGFCMKQLAGTTQFPGVPFGIDPDRIMPDAKGDLPTWAQAQAS